MIQKTDKDFIEPYLKDASNFAGNASILFIPENTEELQEIISDCYKKNIRITISGARTGLTGSAVPLEGAIISMEKLNKIIKIDSEKETATLQPGVVIADFQDEIKQQGFFYAPNPTETNSTIGGNVSTAASGARTFKYGTTRDFIKQLSILLANGDSLKLNRGEIFENDGIIKIRTEQDNEYIIPIHDINMPNVKHAAGYYLKNSMDAIDLFIGSEGTLGIVAEIEVGIVKIPEKILGLIVFFDNEEKMLDFVVSVRTNSINNNDIKYDTNKDISARLIEFFDNKSLGILRQKFPQIPENCAGAIWVEQEYSSNNEDVVLTKWYEIINKYTSFSDSTWTALNESEHKRLMEFRHELPLQVYELISKFNSIKIGTDSSVPPKYLKEYYYFLKEQLENSGLIYFLWGHIGNSHFHANLLSKDDSELLKAKVIYRNCIAKALEYGGTVSAEHGIGKMKKEYLLQMYGEEKIGYMKKIKNALDPKSALGSGNMFL
ncbi:MAG: FAD-binding oxidoreductase [bacterium]